jgi:hypothetical protein
MEHFVTLFNSLFLPQGLALHRSMERHIQEYTLWILCVDDVAYEVLYKLALPNVRLLELAKLETAELLRVKQDRTIAEYCWTLTPFAPRFVFDADLSVARVTYVDADLWFRKNPAPIFCEFEESRKHVLITDHGYAPEYDQSAAFGQYCVQFMTFNREGGEYVRKWWAEKCVEWCYARREDGRFGDQKYLDDWPVRFYHSVHVLVQQDLMQAPWNAIRFPYSRAVVYHFHGLRLIEGGRVLLAPNYPMPKTVVEDVYKVYLEDFAYAVKSLKEISFEVRVQTNKPGIFSWLEAMLRLPYQNLWRLWVNRVLALS